MSTIGLRVRLERDRVGITLDDLAARCGVSPALQQDIENDRRSPEADYLGLADQAGLDVVFILTGQRRPSSVAEQQLVADYRAADDKGRSALEAPAGTPAAQSVAAPSKTRAQQGQVKGVVASLVLVGVLIVAIRTCTAGIDEIPEAHATAPPIVYSPQQQASAAGSFARDAGAILTYTDSLMDDVKRKAGTASDATVYAAMKDAKARLYALKLPPLPPELHGDAVARKVADELQLVVAVRAAAMEDGMEFLDTRKPSELVEHNDRVNRSKAKVADLRKLLPQLAPQLASQPKP